jgi:hypothetical protein
MSFLSRRRLGSVSFKKWFHIWYPVLWTSSLSITSRPWHVHILIRLHRDTSTPPHVNTTTRPHSDTSTPRHVYTNHNSTDTCLLHNTSTSWHVYFLLALHRLALPSSTSSFIILHHTLSSHFTVCPETGATTYTLPLFL